MLDNFLEEVENIEDLLDRLVLTSLHTYDGEFHMYVMKETKGLISRINESTELSKEEKLVIIATLSSNYEFALAQIEDVLK